jgi:hypothetical protein
MKADIGLVVLSCDKYSELWEPLSSSILTNWPDCPFDKYLVSNYLDFYSPYFKTIKVGDDISWSGNILEALKILKNDYKYILVTLDDLFLASKVDTLTLSLIINTFLEMEGNFLSLIQSPRFTKKYNEYFGEIEPGALYRPTCVFGLWKLTVLESLIIPSENAWEFERNGSLRSNKFDKFFSVYKSVFIYRNIVVRGKILRKEATDFNLVDCKQLKTMSLFETAKFHVRHFIFKTVLSIIPWKLQKRLRSLKDKLIRR